MCPTVRGKASCPLCLQEAVKSSGSGAAQKAGQASTSSNVSSPHSVWNSFPDAIEQGAGSSNAGAAEAAAAEARKELVTAASGMMAEAGRLASDIISAGDGMFASSLTCSLHCASPALHTWPVLRQRPVLMPEASTSRTEGNAVSKGGGEGEDSVSNAELSRRREAAQAVFAALFKAQEAAAAAAQASGAAELVIHSAVRPGCCRSD